MKYRIVEFDFYDCKKYLTQRKSIFGFWYNPDNIDAYQTGWYDSLEEAHDMLDRKMHKTKHRVIYSTEAKDK